MGRSWRWMKKEFLDSSCFKSGKNRPTAPVVYVLFDLLWENGRDLTGKNIVQRREQLQEPQNK
jgi:ATP-dependent DNA ligase